jgi:hypothetical protein
MTLAYCAQAHGREESLAFNLWAGKYFLSAGIGVGVGCRIA